MKFDILKTRRGKLEAKISEHILKKNIKGILDAVDEYEKDNLDTIEKLKRHRSLEINKINGALKQSINAHGPITKQFIGSASKRIYGSLLDSSKKESIFIKVMKLLRLK